MMHRVGCFVLLTVECVSVLMMSLMFQSAHVNYLVKTSSVVSCGS